MTASEQVLVSVEFVRFNYKTINDVGFEILTAAVTKMSTGWVTTPCNSLKVNRRF
jgi:hypothetical protein